MSFSEMTATGSGHFERQTRIVVREPALGLGSVELADLVARLGVVDERLVAVREPLRHVERPAVLGAELGRDVLEEGRALGPQVDDDVDDRAARRAHELGLGGAAETGNACRAASLPLLKATLACAITGLRPCSANSCWQNARAK